MPKVLVKRLLFALILVLPFMSTASAADVKGQLLLGAYKPKPDAKPKRSAFNWELENGFKQVRKDRVAADREIAVVLVGEGQTEGIDRAEVDFSGGSILPSTVVVKAGATIQLTNRDEIAHELHAVGLDGFNAEATSPKGRRSINLKQAGNWPLRDKLVSHVHGHLHVLADLVAIAKVDATGRYAFTGVAPGKYTLKVFHGANEVASQAVEVGTKPLAVDPMALTAEADDKK